MNIIIILLIFCIVLFLYLHIIFHLKKNNDLEILHSDNLSYEQLNELCDIRQPVLFLINKTLFNFINFKDFIFFLVL